MSLDFAASLGNIEVYLPELKSTRWFIVASRDGLLLLNTSLRSLFCHLHNTKQPSLPRDAEGPSVKGT